MAKARSLLAWVEQNSRVSREASLVKSGVL